MTTNKFVDQAEAAAAASFDMTMTEAANAPEAQAPGLTPIEAVRGPDPESMEQAKRAAGGSR